MKKDELSSDTYSEARLQFVWLLYKDLNSRFNTLIEEAAYLQDTIYGLSNLDFYSQSNTNFDTSVSDELQIKYSDTKRDWYAQGCNTPTYIDDRERTLLGIWNHVGAIAKVLCANQKTHRKAFEKLLLELNSFRSRASLYYFPYVAQRGYFVIKEIRKLTEQLHHSQETLTQLLESERRIFALPPLLRRWNSGKYGEFQSSYSRHIKWETLSFLCDMEGLGAEAYTRIRNRSFFIHSWSYKPSSENKILHVNSHTLGSVRSAFFYLEMASLLPLLYIEATQISIAEIISSKEIEHKSETESFVLSKSSAADSIKNAFLRSLPVRNEVDSTSENLANEIWSDVVSVSLSGSAFLYALAMQIYGDDPRFFEVDPGETLLDSGKFFYAADPSQIDSVRDEYFFWEARIAIATWMHQKLKPNEDSEWISILNANITEYWDSGYSIYEDSKMSEETRKSWLARAELIKRIVSSCKKILEPHIKQLALYSKRTNRYVLDETIAPKIEGVVNSYNESVFSKTYEVPFHLEAGVKLEALSFRKSLHQSKILANIILDDDQEHYGPLTEIYSNYFRSDGGNAFRIGLEWFVSRESLYSDAADSLSPINQKLGPIGSSTNETVRRRELNDDSKTLTKYLANYDELRENALQEIIEEAKVKETTEEIGGTYPSSDEHNREKILEFIRLKKIHNCGVAGLAKAVDFSNSPLTEFLACIELATKRSVSSFPSRIHSGSIRQPIVFGMMTFIRAHPFMQYQSLTNIKLPYLDAVESFEISNTEINRNIDSIKNYSANGKKVFNTQVRLNPPVVYPLLGEYSAVVFQNGLTPVERQRFPSKDYKFFANPRHVVLVAGNEFDKYEKLEQPSMMLMVKFAYRWRWHMLSELLLNKDKFKTLDEFSVYLSSGWEDAIVCLTAPTERDLLNVVISIKKELGPHGINTQTNLIRSNKSLLYSEKIITDPIGPFVCIQELVESLVAKKDYVEAAYITTGRYDLIIVWAAKTLDALENSFAWASEFFRLNCSQVVTRCEKDAAETIAFKSYISMR